MSITYTVEKAVNALIINSATEIHRKTEETEEQKRKKRHRFMPFYENFAPPFTQAQVLQ